ncbi:sensor histidine kinase [Telmatobacter bradus]|uniref:sensor histidine kinase n=1 Tax=Telmatobacter bradus TaxID=474953 RepID=UPI003B4316D7
MMRQNKPLEWLLQWLETALAAILTSCILVGLNADATTAGLVFLTLVVWFASRISLRMALFAALLCAAAFDYYFLLPLHTFRIVGLQQWVALGSYIASCLVVGRLAELMRLRTQLADYRRLDVERLFELGKEMMLHEDADQMIRSLPLLIDRIFALNGVVLYVRERDQFQSSTDDLPMSIQASLRAMVQEPGAQHEIPGGFSALTLMVGLDPVGVLAWSSDTLPHEVAMAICAQVAIAVARSITLEKAAHIEAARESERLRTALTDSLTHELRTPLTSIRAAASVLCSTSEMDEESRSELAAIIDEESARLDLLIGEAIEMAEIDSNSVEVTLNAQQPRALLEEAVAASRTTLAARRVVVAPSNDPLTPVWLDTHLLGRVLRHLLENAAAHTPDGTRIRLSFQRHADRIEFLVEDEGPGIDPRDLPLIFEKFYRGKQKFLRRKGSGMGLAIARAILIAHSGGIIAVNLPSKGASFRFWVPLLESAPTNEK